MLWKKNKVFYDVRMLYTESGQTLRKDWRAENQNGVDPSHYIFSSKIGLFYSVSFSHRNWCGESVERLDDVTPADTVGRRDGCSSAHAQRDHYQIFWYRRGFCHVRQMPRSAVPTRLCSTAAVPSELLPESDLQYAHIESPMRLI